MKDWNFQWDICTRLMSVNKQGRVEIQRSRKVQRAKWSITMVALSFTYKDCSESTACYSFLLVHNIKGRCWWYGSTGWIFLLIFHFIDMQQMAVEEQSDSMTFDMEVWMEQRCVVEFVHTGKKMHSLTFTDIYWMFMETKQWILVEWDDEWCISAMAAWTLLLVQS